MKDNLIFLNDSVDNKTDDVIGFDSYVNKLSDAIEADAQMIAVTSPFGSGKTSIIDLLIKKRETIKNERILKVPMWSQLNNLDCQDKSNELHKNFLYQIGNAIDGRKGTYINRRLSGNYGLLKLHVNKPIYWILVVLSILLAIFGWVAKNYTDILISFLPFLKDAKDYIFPVSCFLALTFIIIIITRAEIIFSSKNSENSRNIESDEIIDLYRNEILNRKGILCSTAINILQRIPFIKYFFGFLNTKKYIVVIEDLDRSDNGDAVIKFLMELRKYYILSNTNKKVRSNKVVFIVNIKPETSIFDELSPKEKEKYTDINGNLKQNLYAKLFDYILNLQTINIVDYDTILKGLLENKSNNIKKLLNLEKTSNLLEIPGMQWIIRGQEIDIREIKNRLNRAFLIYETLVSRFPDKKREIDFEKCCVASYVTIFFEKDFINTDDNAFEKLIEYSLIGKLDYNNCNNVLALGYPISTSYVDELIKLIEAQLISDDYRMYFYNYPKKSKILNNDEAIIQKAILYDENSDNLNSIVKDTLESGSDIIENSFKKLNQLKIKLPLSVMHTENLFLQAIKYSYDLVLSMFEKMNTSEASVDKNIASIISILNYDKNRTAYNQSIIKDFCAIWETIFDEDSLLKLRGTICNHFDNEIMWYKQLFSAPHSLISINELTQLSLSDGLDLIDIESDNFSEEYINYVVERFTKTESYTEELSQKVKSLIINTLDMFDYEDILDSCFMYMLHTKQIVPECEQIIISVIAPEDGYLDTEPVESYHQRKEIFDKYREVINNTPVEKIAKETLNNINSIDEFDTSYDYTEEVASLLIENGYTLMYILVCISIGIKIDFSNSNIIEGIKNNIKWLKDRSFEFLSIREQVIKNATNIFDYSFCFDDNFEQISEEEFKLLITRADIDKNNILDFIPSNADDTIVPYVVKYLNLSFIHNNQAFEIIKSISKFDDTVIKLFWDSLDFTNVIQYYRFSGEKKNEIKNAFQDSLYLDSIEGQLQFMNNTRYLDSTLDKSLVDNLSDEEDQELYVHIVDNRLDGAITQYTIKNITSLNRYPKFVNFKGICERLFREKRLLAYVIIKSRSLEKFEMDEANRLDLLWGTYIEIFAGDKFDDVQEYMSQNTEFLELIRDKQTYEDFDSTTLMRLSKIKQNVELLNEVFSRGQSFAISYFSDFDKGFVDYNSEKEFVRLLGENTSVLKSDTVRNNAYNQLWDRSLKARYTTFRKANGCSY